MRRGFGPAELQAPYPEWQGLIAEPMPEYLRQWVALWEFWDYSHSPMEDQARGKIRYGHYLGYFISPGPRPEASPEADQPESVEGKSSIDPVGESPRGA